LLVRRLIAGLPPAGLPAPARLARIAAPMSSSRVGWALWFLLQAPRQARFPFRSTAAIEADQGRRLAATIAHARRHVPYYRETMARLGLVPGDFVTAADLARLPLLDRGEVQRDPERFVSDAQPIERYVARKTGGSSGEPLTVYSNPFALVQAAAFHQRAGSLHRRIARRRLGCRTMLIGGQRPQSMRPVTRMLARLRKLAGAEVRLASNREPLERTLEEIDSFRPHVVCSYGSYMEALFESLRASGRQIHLPRLVVYGSDAMSAAGRALVSEGFGIPVLSVYGAHEAVWPGFECEEHLGFHLNLDLSPIRIVDEDGREVADGESGEVVVSNLVNRGTTLLNYRLGDAAHKMPTPCPCGRTLPLLSFVEGRLGDWVQTPTGQRMHEQALRGLFSGEREIRRYQVVQRTRSHFAIGLVASSDCNRQSLEARLAAKFVDLLGDGTTVEVAFVEDLPRTAGGKVRNVVGLERAAATDAGGSRPLRGRERGGSG
jgi:phenylacetate-CoA ligase